MFDNIRKIILYLLSDAFAEIIVVMGSIILGLPLPITAVQIIWINLVSDGFPGLALTIDPKRPRIMQEPPRSPQEKLVNNWMVALIAIVSIIGGGMALIVYLVTLQLTGNVDLARSLCFATLGLDSLVYVFSVRTLTTPFWENRFFENRWLVVAVLAGLLLQMVPFMTPATRSFFGVIPLSLSYWFTAATVALLVFAAIEVFKLWVRKYLKPS